MCQSVMIVALAALCGLMFQILVFPPPPNATCPSLHVTASRQSLVAVVTGKCEMHGLEERTARKLLEHGVGRIYLACPTLKSATAIAQTLPNSPRTIPHELNLGSLTSVALFAKLVLEAEHERIDVLITNSAYDQRYVLGKTENGLENHIAINHLAPAFLARLLQPRRFIHVSMAPTPPTGEDLDIDNWVENSAVPNVLLAQALFVQELAKRQDLDVASNLVVLISPHQVKTQIYLALAENPLTGTILENDSCAVYAGVKREYYDAPQQKLLWHATEYAVDEHLHLLSGRKGEELDWAEYEAPRWTSYQAAYTFQSTYLEHHKERELEEQQHASLGDGQQDDSEELREQQFEECNEKVTLALQENSEYFKENEAALRMDFQSREQAMKQELDDLRAEQLDLEAEIQSLKNNCNTACRHKEQELQDEVSALKNIVADNEETIAALTKRLDVPLKQCEETNTSEWQATKTELEKEVASVKIELANVRHDFLMQQVRFMELEKKNSSSVDELERELRTARRVCLFRQNIQLLKERQAHEQRLQELEREKNEVVIAKQQEIDQIKLEKQRETEHELEQRMLAEQAAREKLRELETELSQYRHEL